MVDEISPNLQQREDEDSSTSRRTFLSYVAAAISSFIGILAGVPLIGYVTSPTRKKEKRGEWIVLGSVDEFSQQQGPKMVNLTIARQDGWVHIEEGRIAWVVPEKGGNLTVFNGRCTHLGCAYSWQTKGKYAHEFQCPCHNGVYDREGHVISGPPPRPLDSLETRVQNGQLHAFYQDFHLGVPDKEPIGL